MKLASWNVNGLRACMKKGFPETFSGIDADIFCVQETKMEQGQAEVDIEGFQQYWNSADKKGYAGTAVFTRITPLRASYGMGIDEHDREGRVITLEFNGFYLVTVYTPNSQRELARLDYRMRWEDDFRKFVCGLDAVKPVIICGDFNCAHQEIDLKHPKTNERNAGFTWEERGKITELLDSGFTDFYRHYHPDARGVYTWWSYMPGVREKNVGWRIDYFFGSDRLVNKVIDASVHDKIPGSDHCPVSIVLNF